ncbi:unnamed protein product [Blepharisma stoltei]|uniref:Misato Segment II tubulin-like domain-containing protein n=1 Tax=Blepharisma stoltei TaxID=1481888 RepID=A0AAU9IEI7_9CILI|nr:unnamed protein product [Blepharisma stoltei]
MKEILTFQLGNQGNFAGAYFWQIQDAYQHGFEFHDPFFIQNADRYYPRMIGLDWKASLSYPTPRLPQSEILWREISKNSNPKLPLK